MLDEPTNHLDLRYQLELLRFIREIGATVIAALHDLNLAAMFCDRLCLMQAGRVVVQETPDQVLTAERLSEVYGIDALIERHPVTGSIWVLPA